MQKLANCPFREVINFSGLKYFFSLEIWCCKNQKPNDAANNDDERDDDTDAMVGNGEQRGR